MPLLADTLSPRHHMSKRKRPLALAILLAKRAPIAKLSSISGLTSRCALALLMLRTLIGLWPLRSATWKIINSQIISTQVSDHLPILVEFEA